MLWHIVRFHYPNEVTDVVREAHEAGLRGLADDLDMIRCLRVARDVVDDRVTGLVVGLDDEAALERYRDHPEHVPVADRGRELCSDITRLDIVTADPPDALPRVR